MHFLSPSWAGAGAVLALSLSVLRTRAALGFTMGWRDEQTLSALRLGSFLGLSVPPPSASLFFTPSPSARDTQRTFRTPCSASLASHQGVNAQSCVTLCGPMNYSPPGSSVIGIFQQECWSQLPFLPPGDLPNPGIEATSPASPALTGEFFTRELPGSHQLLFTLWQISFLRQFRGGGWGEITIGRQIKHQFN